MRLIGIILTIGFIGIAGLVLTGCTEDGYSSGNGTNYSRSGTGSVRDNGHAKPRQAAPDILAGGF